MIAIVKHTATPEQLAQFVSWIEARGYRANVSKGDNETIVGIIGDTTQIDPFLLESMDIIERVQRISEPFKRANRKFHPDDTIIDLGDGILYKVCVQTADGKRVVVAEETVRTHEWRPIRADLRPWAKDNVRLILIADCGPKNNTNGDWAAWGDCRLTQD